MILTFPMSLCSTLSIFCDNTNNSILYLSFPFFFSSLSPHFKPRQFKSFTCFIRRCWLCTDYEWWAGIDIMKWGQHLWPNAHRNRRKCWWSIPIVFLFQHITFMTGEGLGEAWWGDSVNIPIAMLSVLRQKWGWGIWRTVFW